MEIKIIKKTKVNLDLSAEHTYYGKIKGKPNLYFTDRLYNILSLNLNEIDESRDGRSFLGSLYYGAVIIFSMLACQGGLMSLLLYFSIAFSIPIIFIWFLQRIHINPLSFKTSPTEAFDKYDDGAANIITNAVDNYIAFNKLKDKNYKDTISKITINSTKANNCSYCNSHIVNSKCQGCGA